MFTLPNFVHFRKNRTEKSMAKSSRNFSKTFLFVFISILGWKLEKLTFQTKFVLSISLKYFSIKYNEIHANWGIGELSVQGIVRSGNCPVGELSGRGIVRSGNCPEGNCPAINGSMWFYKINHSRVRTKHENIECLLSQSDMGKWAKLIRLSNIRNIICSKPIKSHN